MPEEAFIMMGDHVGYSLRSCKARGVARVVLAGQFAKLLKIACGHQQTHVSSSILDLKELERWVAAEAATAGFAHLAGIANTARQVLEGSGNDPSLIGLVCNRAKESALRMAPGLLIEVILVGYDSEALYYG